jgi:putative transposase
MDRTYQLQQYANKGKQSKSVETVKAYCGTAGSIAAVQWRLFYESGTAFNKQLGIKTICTPLSERYKQTCQYQVCGILNSFVSKRQNDVTVVVLRSSLSEETKRKLLIINSLKRWQNTAVFSMLESKIEIDAEALRLGRKIFGHLLSKHRKPSMRHINMALDSKVALISEKSLDEGKAKAFDYWVRLSTLDKGKPVYIPVKTNGYYDSIPGKKKNFCQVNLDENNELSVSFIKDVPKNADYVPLTPKISLDLGLCTLFASDKGDLYGRKFFEVLKKYDGLITSLAANRQRQGLKTRSPKYDNIVDNLRQYLKNEINRVLNRVVTLYRPAEIVVEKLDFRSPNLSRRMNRLITNFGKNIVKQKLSAFHELYGIKITETNPAYSSQECSVCGYVDAKNRKTQSVFVCRCCNTGIHADVNSSRNHLARSSDVLRILTGRFLSNRVRSSELLHRKAQSLLPDNPYFRGYPAQLEGFS